MGGSTISLVSVSQVSSRKREECLLEHTAMPQPHLCALRMEFVASTTPPRSDLHFCGRDVGLEIALSQGLSVGISSMWSAVTASAFMRKCVEKEWMLTRLRFAQQSRAAEPLMTPHQPLRYHSFVGELEKPLLCT
ncbi:hypothetical protein EK904_014732 [Melospiza melodia maxima]|nr:hypothetical protein EK904_014732 [Melospiza melodia maxima]